MSLVGRTLLHYRVLEKVGAGGMGEVYRALDTKLEREVAIKVLPAGFLREPEHVARLKREALMLAALNHPNIAAIYDLEEAEGNWFLALEFVPRKTLADRIARGPLGSREALVVFQQIAAALDAAHEKLVKHLPQSARICVSLRQLTGQSRPSRMRDSVQAEAVFYSS